MNGTSLLTIPWVVLRRSFIAALVIAGEASHELLLGVIIRLVNFSKEALCLGAAQRRCHHAVVKNQHFTALGDLEREKEIVDHFFKLDKSPARHEDIFAIPSIPLTILRPGAISQESRNLPKSSCLR